MLKIKKKKDFKSFLTMFFSIFYIVKLCVGCLNIVLLLRCVRARSRGAHGEPLHANRLSDAR